MSKGWRWFWIFLVLVVVVAAVLLLRHEEPIEVRVTPVERGRVEDTVTNSRAGTVKARQRTRLSPESGGRAIAIPHREGERVEKGEVLLRLDPRLQQAQVQLAEEELEAARSEERQACLNAERAERELERIRRLAQDRIVSEDLLDETESAQRVAAAACQAASSRVERARASLDLARVQLDYMTLHAPFDGIIADVSIEVGEWTSPSPPAMPIPPVIDLLDPSSIYISAPMDEVDAARLEVGQRVRVTVDSHRGETFWGTLVRIADFVLDVEAQNRTVEIEVDLDDREFASRLKPGTSADVEVILEVHEDVLRVPTTALVEGDSVLVLEGDALAAREIGIGLKNWNWTEVLSGLEAGELVVTSLDRAEVQAGVPAVAVDESAAEEGR